VPPSASSRRTAAAAALLLAAIPAAGTRVQAQTVGGRPPAAPAAPTEPAGDSAAVAATMARFHAALAAGDSAAALALLAAGATVLESGGVESRDEYRAHHLPADIAFARAVPAERGPVRVWVRGDVAWGASTSVARGAFRGRAVDAAGAELMVLTRAGAGAPWRIAAIHWSSRPRPTR
jgi:ketosteroid isomerase-like protein